MLTGLEYSFAFGTGFFVASGVIGSIHDFYLHLKEPRNRKLAES